MQRLRDRHSHLFEKDLVQQQGASHGGGNRYIEELQHRLSALEEENVALRRSVEEGAEALKKEKLKRTTTAAHALLGEEGGGAGAGAGAGAGGSPAVTGHVKVLQDRLAVQDRELATLREQHVDQVEQIEVRSSEKEIQ